MTNTHGPHYWKAYRVARKHYAPDYRVFNGMCRVIRTLSAEERIDYDAGYLAGRRSLTAAQIQRHEELCD